LSPQYKFLEGKMMDIRGKKLVIFNHLKWVVTISVAIGVLTGCSKLLGFFEQAPLEDGLYLSYNMGEGSWFTVEFKKISNNEFFASTTSEYEDEMGETYSSKGKRVTVDKRLNKESGAIYDADILGPLWTAPSSIKSGGTIHGTYIDEVTKWKGWEVGVIKAGFGRGAITGTWYYEKKTGFLVGGHLATVMDENGTRFELEDTNLEILMPQ
jgi:hypothetical protein